MKRPDVSTLVGVSLIAAGALCASVVLAGSSERVGSVVEVDARSSASIATAGTPRSAGPPAVPVVAAAVGGGANFPAAATTPPTVITVTAGETAQVLTTDQWQLIQAAFPTNTYTMARIAFCESRFKDAIVGEGRYVGWFQIDPEHAPGADLTNPVVNVLVASYLAAIKPDLSDWPLTRFGCADWNKAEASTR